MGILSMMLEAKSLHGYYPIVHVPLYTPLAMFYQVVSIFWLLLTSPLTGDIITPYNVAPQFAIEPGGRSKVAIVTGANTGIGFETARSLVLDHGMTVILACRTAEKGMAAAEKINAQLVKKTKKNNDDDDDTSSSQEGECDENSGKAIFYPLDLTSFDSVTEFSAKMKQDFQQIDVLVNNAGMGFGVSTNEWDIVFQSNFLGHYMLTSQLMDVLAKGARVVNLSSVLHHFVGMFDIEDAEIWKGCCLANKTPTATYPFSKVAMLFFSMELNRRYPDRIRSIAVNPGGVNSDIWRNFPPFMLKIFKLIYLNNEQGARPSVVAAVGELEQDAIYLQPYYMPFSGVPFPAFEMLGPYVGHKVTPPRLPADGGIKASLILWETAGNMTNATWPSV